jgi:hypothetical protein
VIETMLDVEFSRAKFVGDGDPQQRCRALSDVLTKRLKDAPNSHQAIEWIMADLRQLGHEVPLRLFECDLRVPVWRPSTLWLGLNPSKSAVAVSPAVLAVPHGSLPCVKIGDGR